ncbi:MAG: hypothetical protein ACLF0G_08560 [Candidatus Brocadiia bacterium]
MASTDNSVSRDSYGPPSMRGFVPAGSQLEATLVNASGRTQWMALPPGMLDMGASGFNVFKDIGCDPPGSQPDIYLRAVTTVGRPPASPRLMDEVPPDRGEWTRQRLRGRSVLKGRFVGPRRSEGDRRLGERWRQHALARVRAKVDPPASARRFVDPQDAAYQSGPNRRVNCRASPLVVTIDWEERTAALAPFFVETTVKRRPVSRRRAAHKPGSMIWRRMAFQPRAPGRATYHAGGIRDITGGTLTTGMVIKSYSLEVSKGQDGKSREELELRTTTTVPQVHSRGKPIQIRWQAVPQPNGTFRLRVYVHPYACRGFGSMIPAQYEFVLTYASGTPLLPSVRPRPTPPPDEERWAGGDPGRGRGEEWDRAPGFGPPDAAGPLRLGGQGRLNERWEDWLDWFFPPGPLSDAAVTAGAVAGLLLLLLGAANHAGMSLAMQTGAGGLLPYGPGGAHNALFDPYTGAPLETGDDGRIWWPWGDDAGWVDRATAEQYVHDGLQEQRDRQSEFERTWQQIQDGRDQRIAQQAGNDVWNDDLQAYVPPGYTYDQQRGALVPPGYAWNDDAQMYLPEPGYDPDGFGNVGLGYQFLDIIDDCWYHLSPTQQGIVRNQLEQLGLGGTTDASRSQLEQLTPEQLDRLASLTHSVYSIHAGRRESIWAGEELMEAWMGRREETIGNFATGLLSLGVVAGAGATGGTAGVVAANAGLGFAFGPTTPDGGVGQRLTNAAISGAAGYAGARVGAYFAPGNVIAHGASGAALSAAEVAAMGGSTDDIKTAALFGGVLGTTTSGLRHPGFQRAVHGGPPIIHEPVHTAYANWESGHVPPRPGTPIIRGPTSTAFADHQHLPPRPAGATAGDDLPTIRGATDQAYANWPHTPGRPDPGLNDTGLHLPVRGPRGGRPASISVEEGPMRPAAGGRSPGPDGGERIYDLGDAPSPGEAQRQQNDLLRQLGGQTDAAGGSPDGAPRPGQIDHDLHGFSGEEAGRNFERDYFILGPDDRLRPAPGPAARTRRDSHQPRPLHRQPRLRARPGRLRPALPRRPRRSQAGRPAHRAGAPGGEPPLRGP